MEYAPFALHYVAEAIAWLHECRVRMGMNAGS